MDIHRPDLRRKKNVRRAVIGGSVLLVIVLGSVGLTRLETATPSVSRASVWIGEVRSGEMILQVRGPGTLVPREIRWIAAQTDARVERILMRPGALVEPGTVLVEMSNAELMQEAEEARHEVEAAQAELTQLEARLRSEQLAQQATLAAARAEYEAARLQVEAESGPAKEGIVPAIQYQRSKLLAEQLKIRMEVEEERLQQFSASMAAQIAAQRARLEQVRNAYQRRADQVESLQVRAGISGVLQQVLVEEGQRVTQGANLARVARPDELQAELQIPETQARDVQIGQKAIIDTRNGMVEGRVIRIDPAVQSGTVQVDVELIGELPRGARPDLSVDGTIEIERLSQVVFTGRPARTLPNTETNLFKLVDGGRNAVRVPVKIGRTSVDAVEIVHGLAPGDEIILSDTSAWDGHARIVLN